VADWEEGHTREGTIAVEGAELAYTEMGEGPALLLVHGSGPDSRVWSPSAEQLARDHRVITYDRRGYGRSAGAPLVAGWRQHYRDAASIMKGLEIGPAGVVGWSGGGWVAIDLALEHPELVRAIVLAETAIPYPPAAGPSVLGMLVLTRLQKIFRGERRGAETFLRWVLSEDGTNTLDRPDFPQEGAERMLANAHGIWADLSPRGRPGASADRLGLVHCPTTLLIGDMGLPWFRRSAELFTERLPDATIVTVEGSNHAFTFHQPERFAEAIREATRA
jgi:3-oxoadipate enol-lactonase